MTSRTSKRRTGVLLLAVWLALLVAVVALGLIINTTAETVPLQLSTDAAAVAEELRGEDLDDVRAAIAWDFLFPLVYVPLIVLWILYAIRRFYVIPATRELGRSLILVVIIAGLADWVENTLHLLLLSDASRFVAAGQWQATWASAFAAIKWIGLALGVAYVLPATIWTVWLMVSRLLPWRISVQELPDPERVDHG